MRDRNILIICATDMDFEYLEKRYLLEPPKMLVGKLFRYLPYRITKYKPMIFTKNNNLIFVPSRDYDWFGKHFYARRTISYFKKKFTRKMVELDPYCDDDEWNKFWNIFASNLIFNADRNTKVKTKKLNILTKPETDEQNRKRKAAIKAARSKKIADGRQDIELRSVTKNGINTKYFE